MKKYIRVLAVIAFIILGSMGNLACVNAGGKDNSLLEGLSIEGPDYTYEYKDKVSFTLYKVGEESSKYQDERYREQEKYQNLHYSWSSNNEEVAKFSGTQEYYFSGCCGIPYPVLDRPNYFKIKGGNVVISCTISDNDGNSVVLSKKLTVIKETPIKGLKFGKYKFEKEDLNADSGVIYTNEIAKNLELQLDLEEGWRLKSQNIISINSKSDFGINVIVENKNQGTEFTYRINIKRYTVHQIDLKNLNKECSLVKRVRGAYPAPWPFALIIKYDKNSKSTDLYTFKDGPDLVRKLIEYYDYDNDTVEYKNGILFYKETADLKPWTYCTTKEELNNAKEDAGANDDLLRGLSIQGPNYIYGIEDIAKLSLAKDGKSDKTISKEYKGFKFKWSSDNEKVAKFKNIEKKNRKKNAYPILQRLGVFKIKPGKVYIRCKITDRRGESVTMIKEVTVLKGRPIKTLKVGSFKVKKSELKSTKCKRTIWTKKKKVQLKINLSKGWSVKRIKVQKGKKVKDITKKKMLSINSKKMQKVYIILENKKNKQIFAYECHVKKGRYHLKRES